MAKKIMPKTAGFTIFETLIVLAVAGMILLVMFMAIPTLQRNSRNTQRKQDMQAILAAVSHYELNNSGNFPSNADANFGDFATLLGQAHLTLYEPGSVQPNAVATGDPVPANTSDLDQIILHNHAKCDPTNPGNAIMAGYSDVVAFYAIETRTGAAIQCQQL